MSEKFTKLLLVEDNSGDVLLLRKMLSARVPGKFALSDVGCMSEAESHLASNAVDIILLDLRLPDAQGMEAVRRAHAAAPRVPLAVPTGCEVRACDIAELIPCDMVLQEELRTKDWHIAGSQRAGRHPNTHPQVEELSRKRSHRPQRLNFRQESVPGGDGVNGPGENAPALRKTFPAAQVSQLFQIGRCPQVELDARVSEFITSDRLHSRRILNLSPVGTCPPYLTARRRRPIRTGTVETAYLVQSQVKSQVK